jgi:hypothetical protein
MNNALETAGHTFATAAACKARLEGLQMSEHGPENILCQSRVTLLVRVRKIIAAGWRSPAQRHQQPAVQAQRIAHIIEADGVRELGVDQAHQMAPWAEGAGLPVHAGFTCQLWNQIGRDEIAELPQYGKWTAARTRGSLFFIRLDWLSESPDPSHFLFRYRRTLKRAYAGLCHPKRSGLAGVWAAGGVRTVGYL